MPARLRGGLHHRTTGAADGPGEQMRIARFFTTGDHDHSARD